MSDNNNNVFGETSARSQLTSEGLGLMMKGAGYAAVFCLFLLIAYGVLWGISAALPSDSKEADDPTPTSFLIQEMDAGNRVL